MRAAIAEQRRTPTKVPVVLDGIEDSKDSQRHLLAHADNIRIAANARQILARHAMLFPDITRALHAKSGLTGVARPSLLDFPYSVLCEAAWAAMNQENILAVLRASATAEGGSHGRAGARAADILNAEFDSTGADLIYAGHVANEVTPLELALNVNPLGQLALAIYVKHHVPVSRPNRHPRCRGSP